MAVKVSKKDTSNGVRYSISGLTFSQLYRIKNAMAEEERKMKKIADGFVQEKNLAWARQFKDYEKDAHEVFIAANDGCV